MSGGTFQYLYNKSALYISGLPQAAGIGALRRMSMRIRWSSYRKHTQNRADRDRTDSLRILEKRFSREEVSEAEYETMKSVLTRKEKSDKLHKATNR